MQSVRVGQFGYFEVDVVKKDEPLFQSTKEIYKSQILDKFKAGERIQRFLRDIAWDVF